MSQLLNATRWKSPTTATTSFNVTVPATTAGAKLVCVGGGGAIVTAKLGVGGTSFTKRTTSLNSREVSAQDIVDASGGTTTIQITLNGPENVDGYIFEFAPGALGNFVTGANESAGGGNTSVDTEGRLKTGNITTTGATVVFAMFTSGQPGTPGAGDGHYGFEPFGKQYSNEFINTDASKSTYHSLIGVADKATAGTFNAQTSRIQSSSEHQSVIWAYEDLASGTPTFTNPYANDIAAENSLPGNLYSSWYTTQTSDIISGYTDSMSYTPGSTVNFKVDSFNSPFEVRVYRTGFYNHAVFGTRKQAVIAGTPAVQPAPTINSFGGTVCAWSTTASWAVPSDAPTGIYIYNLVRTDTGGAAAQGVFVVRPGTVPGSQVNKILVPTTEFTWQAYNMWGSVNDFGNGTSGYTGRNIYGAAPNGGITTRAYAVSFDRPFSTGASNNITYFWDTPYSLVNFLEGNGYDIDYYSSIDLDKTPSIASRYKIAVSHGHSEYWTDGLRDAYENARDAGTHLIFLSGNTSLWRVRFDPADTDRRNMICYKDSHDTTGYDNTTKYDPVSYTGTWRDLRTNPGGVNNTFRRPESGMTGQWFIGNGTFEDSIAVPNTYRSLPIWRNTTAANAQTITFRGTSTANLNTPGTTLNIDQPSNTQVGDLLIVAVTFTSGPGSIDNVNLPLRRVRVTSINNNQTMVIFAGYATGAGVGTHVIPWTPGANANVSASMAVYGNAVWEDIETSMFGDAGGTTSHTTSSVTNNGTGRWAVCVFGDCDSTGSSKTTSWTAGAGLTHRVTSSNSAGGGPWASASIMDTGGAVSQGSHQYSATAEFGNPQAFAGIMYISPGKSLMWRTVGGEWDYVKWEEPTTPSNLVYLSQQPFNIRGGAANYNGNNYSQHATVRYGITMYLASSGAYVFNAGSWRIALGLSRFRRGTFDGSGDVDITLQQAFINLLGDMGMPPTTLINPGANVNTTPLVMPGTAATAADYGFPVAPRTQYQTIFGATPPTNYDENDSVPQTLGTVFTSSVGGKVYGIRWHFPGALPDPTATGILYSWTNNTTGTQLATVTFTQAQSGWSEALFNSPITITAGTKYVAAVWTDAHYVASIGQFNSAVTSGDLTAPASTAGTLNGKFLSPSASPSYPTSSFGSNGYLVDVLFIGEGFQGWGIPV